MGFFDDVLDAVTDTVTTGIKKVLEIAEPLISAGEHIGKGARICSGGGGYQYAQYPDGRIFIVTGPKGLANIEVKKGTKAFSAIEGEIGEYVAPTPDAPSENPFDTGGTNPFDTDDTADDEAVYDLLDEKLSRLERDIARMKDTGSAGLHDDLVKRADQLHDRYVDVMLTVGKGGAEAEAYIAELDEIHAEIQSADIEDERKLWEKNAGERAQLLDAMSELPAEPEWKARFDGIVRNADAFLFGVANEEWDAFSAEYYLHYVEVAGDLTDADLAKMTWEKNASHREAELKKLKLIPSYDYFSWDDRKDAILAHADGGDYARANSEWTKFEKDLFEYLWDLAEVGAREPYDLELLVVDKYGNPMHDVSVAIKGKYEDTKGDGTDPSGIATFKQVLMPQSIDVVARAAATKDGLATVSFNLSPPTGGGALRITVELEHNDGREVPLDAANFWHDVRDVLKGALDDQLEHYSLAADEFIDLLDPSGGALEGAWNAGAPFIALVPNAEPISKVVNALISGVKLVGGVLDPGTVKYVKKVFTKVKNRISDLKDESKSGSALAQFNELYIDVDVARQKELEDEVVRSRIERACRTFKKNVAPRTKYLSQMATSFARAYQNAQSNWLDADYGDEDAVGVINAWSVRRNGKWSIDTKPFIDDVNSGVREALQNVVRDAGKDEYLENLPLQMHLVLDDPVATAGFVHAVAWTKTATGSFRLTQEPKDPAVAEELFKSWSAWSGRPKVSDLKDDGWLP